MLVGGAVALALALAAEIVPLGGRNLVIERPGGAPKGSILLIPGGTTRTAIDATGNTSSQNFVIRTRALYQQAGYVTAFLDDPDDLRSSIARLRALAPPVVVVATSRGTILAAHSAVALGKGGPDLLVLTSPVTKASPRHPGSTADVNVAAIAQPTLVVTNELDKCAVSPPDGAAALARAIPHAQLVTERSSAADSDPCEPLAPHGYFGIESQTVGAILDWIAHRGQPLIAPHATTGDEVEDVLCTTTMLPTSCCSEMPSRVSCVVPLTATSG